MTTHTPGAALRPFVRTLWHSHSQASSSAQRELSLPTGHAHLVLRLSEHPLRIHADLEDPVCHSLSHSLVGGPRAQYYVREVSHSVESVGAMLLPGAARLLFGVDESELAHLHTPLEDLWGTAARTLRDRLQNAGSPAQKLRLFEQSLAHVLTARLSKQKPLHPAVAHALLRFEQGAGIDQVVRDVGYSHRRFLTLFRSQVGLAPKRYCQVQRFQQAVALVSAPKTLGLAALATYAGYSDQAHFTREFKDFAGVTPGHYLALAPQGGNHVPLR